MAEGAGEVQGLGALDSDGQEIKRLYVRPACQGRGIGTLLVTGLQSQARQAGLTSVQLHASPSSVPFYLALGFQQQGHETTVNGPAEFQHVRMYKPLAAD